MRGSGMTFIKVTTSISLQGAVLPDPPSRGGNAILALFSIGHPEGLALWPGVVSTQILMD